MGNPVRIALHKPTNKFVHVESIEPNDLETRRYCYCLKCDEKLEAVLDFKDKNRVKFFRHHKDPDCEGSQETALHELGKQILVENSQIAIRDHGPIFYSNPIAEKRFEAIRPDVSAEFEGQPIFFEIYVSHAVDEGKKKFFANGKHKSVEINLSDCATLSFEEIKKMILEQTERQTVFYWKDESVSETSWAERLIAIVVSFLVIVGFFRFYFKKRRR